MSRAPVQAIAKLLFALRLEALEFFMLTKGLPPPLSVFPDLCDSAEVALLVDVGVTAGDL